MFIDWQKWEKNLSKTILECVFFPRLTHWGRVTHICISKPTIIGSDDSLSPNRHQAIICTNAGILLTGPLGTNFSEIWIEIQIFSFRKRHLKMSSEKWHPFCLGLNVLTHTILIQSCHTDIYGGGFTWGLRHLKPLATWLFVQQLVHDYKKEGIKAPHHWPFVTKGQ